MQNVAQYGIFAPHARGRFALTGRGMHDCPAAPTVAERAGPTDAVVNVPSSDESLAAQRPGPAARPCEQRRPKAPVTEWGHVCGDDMIAAAVLDRMLHHSHTLVVTRESYRLEQQKRVGLLTPSRKG